MQSEIQLHKHPDKRAHILWGGLEVFFVIFRLSLPPMSAEPVRKNDSEEASSIDQDELQLVMTLRA